MANGRFLLVVAVLALLSCRLDAHADVDKNSKEDETLADLAERLRNYIHKVCLSVCRLFTVTSFNQQIAPEDEI